MQQTAYSLVILGKVKVLNVIWVLKIMNSDTGYMCELKSTNLSEIGQV